MEAAPVPIRDPSDRAILVSALKAGAEVLITGDQDLLVVAKEVSGVRIVDPRTFWQEVSKRSGKPAS
jgi:predicted nucleic acid-binding protein